LKSIRLICHLLPVWTAPAGMAWRLCRCIPAAVQHHSGSV